MKKPIKIFLAAIFLLGILVQCKDEAVPDPEASELTQKINEFIEESMQELYLWEKYLPDIDIRYEFDSKDYFEKLLYEEDKWSRITDDFEAEYNSSVGVETSFGYSLAFGKFTNTGNWFAVVEFVYPNTPAAEAGFKRGDILVLINSEDITEDNYTDLLDGGTITVTTGVLGFNGISLGPLVMMTSRELNLNPVLKTKVVEYEGHKIGYLFYAQYITNFNYSLDTAFQHLLSEQITDLVIDLRYNPGGYTTAAQHLCSSIAPLSVVNAKSTLVTFQWNDDYQQYWTQLNATGELGVKFVDNTSVKLGLSKVYFLTSKGTASASELSITGLRPYMSVVTVGDTTYGKYTGSIPWSPEDLYEDDEYYKEFENWGMWPIVIRYANSEGVTDFKDGFVPDIVVREDIFAGIPLGDVSDPLFKAAIEDITGTEIVAMKEAKSKTPPYKIIDRGFSKYDHIKRELLIDNFDKQDILK